MQTVLAASVEAYRFRSRKGVGHEGDTTLERRVRRHGNMTEYAPKDGPIFIIARMSGAMLTLVVSLALAALLFWHLATKL